MTTLSQDILSQLESYAFNEYRAKLLARLKVILASVEKLGDIKRAILYGSYLSDKTEPSDIDIVVWLENLKDDKHWHFYMSRTEKDAKLSDPKIDLGIMKGALFTAMHKWISGTKELVE